LLVFIQRETLQLVSNNIHNFLLSAITFIINQVVNLFVLINELLTNTNCLVV